MTDDNLIRFSEALTHGETALRAAFEMTATLHREIDREAQIHGTLLAQIARLEGSGPVRVMTSAASAALAESRSALATSEARLAAMRTAAASCGPDCLHLVSGIFAGLCSTLDLIRDSEAADAGNEAADAERSARLRETVLSSRPG